MKDRDGPGNGTQDARRLLERELAERLEGYTSDFWRNSSGSADETWERVPSRYNMETGFWSDLLTRI